MQQQRGGVVGCVPDADKGPVAQLPAAAAAHCVLQQRYTLRCSSHCVAAALPSSVAFKCAAVQLLSNSPPSKVYTVQWGPGLSASEVGNGQIAAGGATQIHAHSLQIQLKYMLGPNANQIHALTKYNSNYTLK